MRLVQMSGGQKKDTTSLEMAVSVVIAPHQIFVRRACGESGVSHLRADSAVGIKFTTRRHHRS